MTDWKQFKGRSQFGPAYEVMLNGDSHACGSVDRTLTKWMIRLCAETADYLYTEYTPIRIGYEQGNRPELERMLGRACLDHGDPDRPVEAIISFTAQMAKSVPDVPLGDLLFGGTEEEIVRRGSDWCTDLARVACLLCQVGGLPARIVNLFDTTMAYSGHVIIEAHVQGRWAAFDPTNGVGFRDGAKTPVSTWEIMTRPAEIVAYDCKQGSANRRFDAKQFRAAAIVNYLIHETGEYNYAVSGINDYYRAILAMSQKGWPSGLRWLFAEGGAEA